MMIGIKSMSVIKFIKDIFTKKPVPEQNNDWDPDFVEEYVYMGDGTMELVRTPRSEYVDRIKRIEKSWKDQLAETQKSVAESKRRQASMKASFNASSSSSSRSSSSSSSSDTIMAAAVYSSYDSGSSSSCDSSSSSSCD